jgi:hypothetical protein
MMPEDKYRLAAHVRTSYSTPDIAMLHCVPQTGVGWLVEVSARFRRFSASAVAFFDGRGVGAT